MGGCSGWLFGFSGLDGETSESNNFVALVEGVDYKNFDLRFCGLKTPRKLSVSTSLKNKSVSIATNDVILVGNEGDVDIVNGSMIITFASWNVMIGKGFINLITLHESSIINGCSVSTSTNSAKAKQTS